MSTERLLGSAITKLDEKNPEIIGKFLGIVKRELPKFGGHGETEFVDVAKFEIADGSRIAIRANRTLMNSLEEAEIGMKLRVRFVGMIPTRNGDAKNYRVTVAE